MVALNLNRDDHHPLVDQIVHGIREQIEEQELRPGARLPSIRAFANAHNVSRFTVVEAYDRLVAQGYLLSRRGAGFFATSCHSPQAPTARADRNTRNDELVWLLRRLLEAREGTVLAGGPWLSGSWLDDANIRRSLRALAGRPGGHVTQYGDPYGCPALRRQLAHVILPDVGVNAGDAQILLTTGASQALDLIVRRMLAPGDSVLVDDPGYYNLFGNLRGHGVRLLGVPRGVEGPDTERLDELAAEHRPKLYFTQSVLQNPTGTSMAPRVAYRVLQSANRHDFRIVEDDIFSDLEPANTTRLATLDQLERVIYVGSFSKTLSGSLRVGFIAANPAVREDLADAKMITGIASSLFSEQLVYDLLADGHYRKFTARTRERIAEARCNVIEAFEGMGMEVFCRAEAGLFLWGRFRHIADSLPLAETASRRNLLIAPGTVFRPNLQPSPWMRFNVAVCDDREVLRAIAGLADEAGR